MRFVVTGAGGHIGNNTVRALRAAYPAADIRTLTRRPLTRELGDVAHTEVMGDLADPAFLAREICAGDFLVHAVGFVDLSGKHAEETYRVNVELTKTITDAALAAGVAEFVYFGSVDGIAKTGDATPICEPAVFDATPISGHYGKSKAIGMEYVRGVMAAHPDFSATILLPSAVLGVHDYKPSPVGNILYGILAGKAEFGIPGGYNFVDVRDVANAVVAACERRARGVYILSGENVGVQELYLAANEAAGVVRRPILLPRWVAWLAMPFVPALNPVTLRALGEPHNYDSAAAANALGFRARPFRDTMRDTMAWLGANPRE